MLPRAVGQLLEDHGRRVRKIDELKEKIMEVDTQLEGIRFYEQELYGPSSDDESLREVHVTARWEGYTIRLFDAGT